MEFNLSILKKWSTYLDSQMPKLFFRQEYNNFAKTFMLLKKVLASAEMCKVLVLQKAIIMRWSTVKIKLFNLFT